MTAPTTLNHVWPIMTRKLTQAERHQAVWCSLAVFALLMGMLTLLPVN
jgi:hypothetical protein